MKKMMLRNGKMIDADIATDRSLLYGDGVFTSIAINNGKPLLLAQHLKRLDKDCQRLKIQNLCLDSIKKTILSAIESVDQAIVRISISRSSGERGYLCKDGQPVYWIAVAEWPSHIESFRVQGINLRTCQQKLSRNPSLAGIKHCNRLEQVLARNEWDNSNFQEGILFDTADNVVEGTMSNLFLIKDHCLFTPDLTFSGVEGIIRGLIIDIARLQDIPLTISNILSRQLKDADALFVTNSVIGIWPVNQLDKQRIERHPMIQQLQDELNKQILL